MALTKQQEEKILKAHGYQWFVELKKEMEKKAQKPGDSNEKILQD
jgi:hypothetical protein